MINLNKVNKTTKINNIIKGENTYSFENTANDKTWTIKIIDGLELLTDTIKEALRDFKEDIFYNNSMCNYYFMMYKVNDTWVEGININPVKMEIEVSLC